MKLENRTIVNKTIRVQVQEVPTRYSWGGVTQRPGIVFNWVSGPTTVMETLGWILVVTYRPRSPPSPLETLVVSDGVGGDPICVRCEEQSFTSRFVRKTGFVVTPTWKTLPSRTSLDILTILGLTTVTWDGV